MTIQYYINGYLFSSGGVYVSKSTGIVDGLKMKEPFKMSWPDHHGDVVDLDTPRYEAREITLDCFIKATNKEDFLSKVQAFIARFMLSGTQRLMIIVDSSKPLVYEVYCQTEIDVVKTWSDTAMIGTFALKLKEPEPVKRVYKFIAATGVMSVNIAITTTDPINIYWGDGLKTYDVVTASGTITHTYASAGTYYIVITGVIDNITNITVSANTTLVWSKL